MVSALALYHHERILSSPYVRCLQTVEPLSAASAVPVELSEALVPDAGDKALTLLKQLTEDASPTVVLSTHREVLAHLLMAVSSEFEITLGHRLPGAKGSLWVLERVWAVTGAQHGPVKLHR